MNPETGGKKEHDTSVSNAAGVEYETKMACIYRDCEKHLKRSETEEAKGKKGGSFPIPRKRFPGASHNLYKPVFFMY